MGNKPITVYWRDVLDSKEAWMSRKQAELFGKEYFICKSVGWIVYEDNRYIVLAADITSDGDYGRVKKIPVGTIVRGSGKSVKKEAKEELKEANDVISQ